MQDLGVTVNTIWQRGAHSPGHLPWGIIEQNQLYFGLIFLEGENCWSFQHFRCRYFLLPQMGGGGKKPYFEISRVNYGCRRSTLCNLEFRLWGLSVYFLGWSHSSTAKENYRPAYTGAGEESDTGSLQRQFQCSFHVHVALESRTRIVE